MKTINILFVLLIIAFIFVSCSSKNVTKSNNVTEPNTVNESNTANNKAEISAKYDSMIADEQRYYDGLSRERSELIIERDAVQKDFSDQIHVAKADYQYYVQEYNKPIYQKYMDTRLQAQQSLEAKKKKISELEYQLNQVMNTYNTRISSLDRYMQTSYERIENLKAEKESALK